MKIGHHYKTNIDFVVFDRCVGLESQPYVRVSKTVSYKTCNAPYIMLFVVDTQPNVDYFGQRANAYKVLISPGDLLGWIHLYPDYDKTLDADGRLEAPNFQGGAGTHSNSLHSTKTLIEDVTPP